MGTRWKVNEPETQTPKAGESENAQATVKTWWSEPLIFSKLLPPPSAVSWSCQELSLGTAAGRAGSGQERWEEDGSVSSLFSPRVSGATAWTGGPREAIPWAGLWEKKSGLWWTGSHRITPCSLLRSIPRPHCRHSSGTCRSIILIRYLGRIKWAQGVEEDLLSPQASAALSPLPLIVWKTPQCRKQLKQINVGGQLWPQDRLSGEECPGPTLVPSGLTEPREKILGPQRAETWKLLLAKMSLWIKWVPA